MDGDRSVNEQQNGGNGGNGSTRTGSKRNDEDKSWILYSSDQPGMNLISFQLTRKNYLAWSTAIKNGLEAKGKLNFLDGSMMPTNSEDLWRWKKADSMVKAWVTNSLTEELKEQLVYCSTTKILWQELEERFGSSCGPLIYQIQRDLAAIDQGSDTVTTYYGKLKKFWDELGRLLPMPRCTCGCCKCDINKRLTDVETANKLSQFLMGLSKCYENIRGYILNLDPLPTVNKALAMITTVEQQQEVLTSYSVTPVESASAVLRGGKTDYDSRNYKRKEDKKLEKCSHCQMNGHLRETCFRLNGYPEWYMELREKKKQQQPFPGSKKPITVAANVVTDTPFDEQGDRMNDWPSMLSMLEKMTKAVKGKVEERVNFAHLAGTSAEFAGNTIYNLFDDSTWIIDTGASSHMCFNKSLIKDFKMLDEPILVHLPNGGQIAVKIGQKGYKLYDMSTHKVIVSRDIIFYENNFPFLDIVSKQNGGVTGSSSSLDPVVFEESSLDESIHDHQEVEQDEGREIVQNLEADQEVEQDEGREVIQNLEVDQEVENVCHLNN
ncbi:uncharacterized protein G2W53_036206 [Senna tora]|uniref:Retrotransposon Copia-like N-terminal domain-containing protein n=1 Tax=Senna tora TaxID=362788 RepID=A0A834W5Q2_9FABA|nr:uncharacterized protein G2W53_036206 [Senna tora]